MKSKTVRWTDRLKKREILRESKKRVDRIEDGKQDKKGVTEINSEKWAVGRKRVRGSEEMKSCLLICSLTGELELISEKLVCRCHWLSCEEVCVCKHKESMHGCVYLH